MSIICFNIGVEMHATNKSLTTSLYNKTILLSPNKHAIFRAGLFSLSPFNQDARFQNHMMFKF